jgi:hypothetical protein
VLQGSHGCPAVCSRAAQGSSSSPALSEAFLSRRPHARLQQLHPAAFLVPGRRWVQFQCRGVSSQRDGRGAIRDSRARRAHRSGPHGALADNFRHGAFRDQHHPAGSGGGRRRGIFHDRHFDGHGRGSAHGHRRSSALSANQGDVLDRRLGADGEDASVSCAKRA